MGAAPGNQNRLTTGRYSLTLGKLPKKLRRVQSQVWSFRRHLEMAVAQVKAIVGPYEAALINTAAAWQRHALLANKWLLESLDELTAAEKVTYSREVARATSERDRVLRALGLDGRDLPTTFDAAYDAMPLGDEIDDEAGDCPDERQADDEGNAQANDEATTLDVSCADDDGASTGTSSSGDDGATDAARDCTSPADETQGVDAQGEADGRGMRASIAPL